MRRGLSRGCEDVGRTGISARTAFLFVSGGRGGTGVLSRIAVWGWDRGGLRSSNYFVAWCC